MKKEKLEKNENEEVNISTEESLKKIEVTLEENEKKIEVLEADHKKDRFDKVLLIIIIIVILLLHWFLCGRLGKIGIGSIHTNSTIIDGNIVTNDNSINQNNSGYMVDVIEVVDGDINHIKSSQLNIFKNELFNGEKIIAPGSYGKYVFCVKNLSGQNITYNISFDDAMTNPVNMKYKLKIDNIYIRGNSNNFVSVNDIDVDSVIVAKDSINIFTLEWYWEHDDVNDTYTGTREEDQTYTLDVLINSSLYTKEI